MAESRGDHQLTFWIALSIVLAIVVAFLIPVMAGMMVTDQAVADGLQQAGITNPDAEQQAAERAKLTAGSAQFFITPLTMGGEIFLRLLKMLVVPLVAASVMSGILGLGDVRKLGRPGAATVLYYLATTLAAVAVGLLLVNVMSPGIDSVSPEERSALEAREGTLKEKLYAQWGGESGATDEDVALLLGDEDYVADKHPSVARVIENLVLMMFTDNLFRSAVNMELLPIIIFSIAFAGLLTTMGDRAKTIVTFIPQVNEALMKFILLVMNFAPLGIFCLVAGRFGQATATGTFLAELQKTGAYTVTVLAGLGIHAFITLPAVLYLFTRRNPYVFMGQMSQALLTAFSTASSSAALPVAIESAIDEAGVSRKSVDFVLPLGATINMDGTALYEAVAAIFIAQVIGADMSLGQQLIVAVTATLAAIGAAGIPEAGLVTMVIVLAAVGLPTEYMSLILSVDWFLDRFRTTVNVFGDACGAAVVERTFDAESHSVTAPVLAAEGADT